MSINPIRFYVEHNEIMYGQTRYPVIVGEGLLPHIHTLAGIKGPIAVVTDYNVGPLYADLIPDVSGLIQVPAGEEHKTLATIKTIYDQLLAAGIDRTGTLIALGGGVIGDMAGFAAATFMRGIPFVQCPTTLLAMVDASVGGKSGVDLPQGKNLVGAFKQPTAVLADINSLQTLPAHQFAAGMAEIIKHSLINNPSLFARIENAAWEAPAQQTPAALQGLIVEAIQVKRNIVQEDPFELGRRALLNLGHTFAHAIEWVSAFQIEHGHAVAMGLVAAAHLSARLGHCPGEVQQRIETALEHSGLPTRIPAHLDSQELYKAMGHDKKKMGRSLRFVLLRDIGDAFLENDVPETAVLHSLQVVSAT